MEVSKIMKSGLIYEVLSSKLGPVFL